MERSGGSFVVGHSGRNDLGSMDSLGEVMDRFQPRLSDFGQGDLVRGRPVREGEMDDSDSDSGDESVGGDMLDNEHEPSMRDPKDEEGEMKRHVLEQEDDNAPRVNRSVSQDLPPVNGDSEWWINQDRYSPSAQHVVDQAEEKEHPISKQLEGQGLEGADKSDAEARHPYRVHRHLISQHPARRCRSPLNPQQIRQTRFMTMTNRRFMCRNRHPAPSPLFKTGQRRPRQILSPQFKPTMLIKRSIVSQLRSSAREPPVKRTSSDLRHRTT